MQRGWRVGHILGIPLRVDASWLVVFALITWSLATSYFPDANTHWPLVMYWILGLITSLLFFTSVILHELGHSVVAIRRGTPVLGITLFIFGGVAWLADEPRTSFDELLIAIVGPVVSFALAFAFGILWLAAFTGTQFVHAVALSPIVASLVYLVSINAMLGLFNLIPGFPLDGGRVLRALLWGASKNFVRATEVASYVGQGIGGLFMIGGFLLLVSGSQNGGGFVDALWILFIGWFLFTAARSSRRQLELRRGLQGLHVREIMRRNFQSLSPEVSLAYLMNHLVEPWSGALLWPVVQNGVLRGLVFRHDVESTPRAQWDRLTSADIMKPRNVQQEVHPQDEAGKGLRLLLRQNAQFLPVVAENQLVGLLFRHDLLSLLQRKQSEHHGTLGG